MRIDEIRTGIVHRDRVDGTVVAVQPSKQVWQANFPDGAAGVLLKNGQIVVGDGPELDHLTLLDHAGVPQEMEAERLQVLPDRIMVECWDDLEAMFDAHPDLDDAEATPDLIEPFTAYPKAKRAEIAAAVRRAATFIPGVSVDVVLRSSESSAVDGNGVWFTETY